MADVGLGWVKISSSNELHHVAASVRAGVRNVLATGVSVAIEHCLSGGTEGGLKGRDDCLRIVHLERLEAMNFGAVKARTLHLEKVAAAEAVLLSLDIACLVVGRLVNAVALVEHL